jgi:hypothetical protein
VLYSTTKKEWVGVMVATRETGPSERAQRRVIMAEERMHNVEPESWERHSPLVEVELRG